MKKKYLLFSAMAVAVALSSCDMDKTPYDALPDTEAMQTPTDFTNARVGLYSGLRSSVGGGAFYNAPEIQCDGFNAVAGFSNTYGDMYYWDFTSQTGEMETVYGNYQGVIARANYIIDGYNKCDFNAGGFTNDDMKRLRSQPRAMLSLHVLIAFSCYRSIFVTLTTQAQPTMRIRA